MVDRRAGAAGHEDTVRVVKDLVKLMGPLLRVVLTTVVLKALNCLYTVFLAVLTKRIVIRKLLAKMTKVAIPMRGV